MRVLIFALLTPSFLRAQVRPPDFYSVKTEIDSVSEMRRVLVKKFPRDREDTAAWKKTAEQAMAAQQAFELKRNELISKLKGTTYPDFYFEDYEGKSYSISDFHKEKVILNYNYSFCDLCMNQIDSLIKLSAGKTKVIVLLYDRKENVTEIFERFGNKILLGFINREVYSHYSLETGSFSIFLLEKDREFYDFYAGHLKDVASFYPKIKDF